MEGEGGGCISQRCMHASCLRLRLRLRSHRRPELLTCLAPVIRRGRADVYCRQRPVVHGGEVHENIGEALPLERRWPPMQHACALVEDDLPGLSPNASKANARQTLNADALHLVHSSRAQNGGGLDS